jgi:transposase
MELTKAQKSELEQLARHGEPGYIRMKVVALLNVSEGKTVAEVSGFLQVSRQSLYNWMKRYETRGVEGLKVASGRGRKGQADLAEIENYLRREPHQFGLFQTRWSLSALARVVPSLKGFTPFGVQKALRRAGFRYKRGQPHLHSPDPDYEAKKGLWIKR